MTQAFDRLMVKAGFDSKDVEQVKGRHFLYAGNIAMLAISTVFLAMLFL